MDEWVCNFLAKASKKFPFVVPKNASTATDIGIQKTRIVTITFNPPQVMGRPQNFIMLGARGRQI